MIEFIRNNGDFFLGISSGLTVAVLVYICGKLSNAFLQYVQNRQFVNVFTKSKINCIYNNQEDAKKQMYKDMEKSDTVFVFAYYELLLSDITGEFYNLLKTKKGNIKILIVDPHSFSGKKRMVEIDTPIATVIGITNILKDLQQKNSNIKLALHNEFIRNRFFIFEDAMYLGFRLKSDYSENLEMWRIGKEGCLYKAFLELFNDYWEKYSYDSERL